MFHNFFKKNGSIKKWHEFKREYNLHQSSYFQWVQLIDSIPGKWKSIIEEKTMKFMITYDHHLIKGSRVIT